MSDQPCHTGPAAHTCGHCADLLTPAAQQAAQQAFAERIRLAWHDISCHAGPDCRYRLMCAQGQPTLVDQLERFLTRLDEIEKDPAW